jgi:hypothetical protein
VFYWNQVLALQERYKDLQREADREHMVRQMLPARERRHHAYSRAASWLGRRLVTWGCRLQENYRTRPTGAGVVAHNPHPTGECAMASCRK